VRSDSARLRILATLLTIGVIGSAASLPRNDSGSDIVEVTRKLTDADTARRAGLGSYSVERLYQLESNGGKHVATMRVRLDYSAESGKHFTILDISKADGFRKHAFQKMLEAEVEAEKISDTTRVNSNNYDFRLLGFESVQGRRCFVLELLPKRKNKYLLNGRAWIDAGDYGLVKLEGRPAASVSFWVGKPTLTQEFQKVENLWLASRNESVTDAKIVGRIRLSIEYGSYAFAPAETSVALRRPNKPGGGL
jgi:hypothetical protein